MFDALIEGPDILHLSNNLIYVLLTVIIGIQIASILYQHIPSPRL